MKSTKTTTAEFLQAASIERLASWVALRHTTGAPWDGSRWLPSTDPETVIRRALRLRDTLFSGGSMIGEGDRLWIEWAASEARRLGIVVEEAAP